MKARHYAPIIVALALGWFVRSFSCFTGPEPMLTASKFVVDLTDEYPIKLKKARLSELGSGQAIWELRRTQDSPRVRQLTFAAGVNNADSIITPKIREGLFEVVEPKGARGFLLRPRVTYKLEVWDDGYFFPAFFSTTRYLRFTKPEVSAPEQPK